MYRVGVEGGDILFIIVVLYSENVDHLMYVFTQIMLSKVFYMSY